MRYCIKCLQPDTRPGTRFDKDGLCPACIYHASLAEADWGRRNIELQEIVTFGRTHSQSGYNCIIGVSGGKDSLRQAIFVKEVLGMNALLVNLGYPPNQVTQRGVDNVANMIRHGFDLSWSRISVAQKWLDEKSVKAQLFVGDLFSIPLADRSVDVVYTSHSLEPNGGKEELAIKELLRVPGKQLCWLSHAMNWPQRRPNNECMNMVMSVVSSLPRNPSGLMWQTTGCSMFVLIRLIHLA